MRKPRDPERIKPFMKKIRSLWKKQPYMRFFQLMYDIEYKAREKYGGDPFYYEENQVESILDEMLND